MSQLDAFVPIDRRVALAEGRALDETCTGAALLADLSGFTTLTARLADTHGARRGAEVLSGHLNRVFAPLIDEIRATRGSVIYFAGDAVMAWFDDAPDGDAVARASACAAAMQAAIERHGDVPIAGEQPLTIALTVAVVAGEARRFLVGSAHHMRMEVLAGPLLDDLEALSAEVAPGEVRVKDGATTDERARAPWTGAGWPEVPELEPDVAAAWVVAPLRERLAGPHSEFLATLRPAVPMFVRFHGIDFAQDRDAGPRLDRYVTWVQEVVAQYDGLVLQATTGDKGSNLQVVFGALHADDDQLTRAIAAALALQAPPPSLGFDPAAQIGVSEGLLFAGTYGGVDRRAFTALGRQTNLAARLMSRAASGEILVADPVAVQVRDRVVLEDRGLVSLKGHPEPVRLWAATGLTRAPRAVGVHSVMVGRDDLLVRLLGHLEARARRAVVIEALSGMGKTALVDALVGAVRDQGATVLRGASDSVDRATPFGPWRSVVASIIGLGSAPSAHDVAHAMGTHLPERTPLAPLIGALLGVTLPETPESAQLTGRVRADNTVDIVVELLTAATAQAHHTVILEDLHWFDEASMELLRWVVRDVGNLLVLATTRPVEGDLRQRLDDLTGPEHAETLTLGVLDRDGVQALLGHHLGVSTVPATLVDFVHDSAQGHPYFTQLALQALRDRGVVQVRGDACVMDAGADHLRALEMPGTISGVLIRRIDELPVDAQTVLKVASVIGPRIHRPLLAEVQTSLDPATLDGGLATLAERRLLRATEDDGVVSFEHEMLRDVVYESLLFQQRQRLHRRLAEVLEAGSTDAVEGRLARLAHHWNRAAGAEGAFDPDAASRAITYLGAAGAASLAAYANAQAARFFLEALDLSDRLVESGRPAPGVPDLARARLHLDLSKAYQGLGDLGRCQEHGHEALRRLGRPVPSYDAVIVASVLWETVRRRIPGARWLQRPYPEAERRRRDLECEQYITLARPYYHTNATTRLLYSNAVKLRHAERQGPSPELAEAWAGVSFVLGLMNQVRRSDRLWARAIEMAEATGQQTMVVTVRVAHAAQNMGHGRLDEVQASMARSREICEALGDRAQWGDCVGMQADAHLLAHAIDRAKQSYDELSAHALQHNNHLHHLWALRGYAVMALRDGRPADATPLLEHAMLLLERTVDQHTRIDILGLLALSHARQGHLEPAFEGALAASTLIGTSGSPSAYGQYLGYGSAAEIFLELQPRVDDLPPAMAARVPGLCRQALRDLGKYSGVMRIGVPQTHRYRGIGLARRGRRRAAQASWRKGLETAQALGLAHEVQLLEQCLRSPAPEDPRPD